MITFWVLALLMVAVVLAVLAMALKGTPKGVARERLNVQLYRDRLAELEREGAAGALTGQELEAARAELQRDLLLTTGEEEAPAAAPADGGRWAIPVVALTMPLLAAVFYLALGSPALVDAGPRVAGAAGQGGMPDVNAMVEKLRKRLAENPNDVDGWMFLGRSYSALERFGDAVQSYAKAYALAPKDADVATQYAEALAMAADGDLAGKPLELLEAVLAAEPEHPMALWLVGMGAYQVGDHPKAAGLWQRLLAVMPPDDPSIDTVRKLLARVQGPQAAAAPAADSGTPAAQPVAIATVDVSLSAQLASGVGPDDTVFVFARAPGSRMPVAAERHRVAELPLQVVLDGKDTLGQGLAGLKDVEIVVRVAKSGGVMPQSGDLEGYAMAVVGAAQPVAVVVDRIVP